MPRSTVPAALALLALAVTTSALPVAGSTAERRQLVEQLRADLREADLALRDGRLGPAADLYRRAGAAARRLQLPNLPLARAIDGLGDVHRIEGRLEQAAAAYVESAAMWPRLLGEGQPRLATTLHNLGAVYFELGRPAAAVEPLRRATAIFESSFGADSAAATRSRALYRRCLDGSFPDR